MSTRVKETISSYVKRVGLRRYSSWEHFAKHLRRKYGADKADELLDAVGTRAEGETVDIYPLIYDSLDLSLDFLSTRIDFNEQYLRWFIKHEIEPRRVLDLGCGNGFLTCFYARLFPDSAVLGLDNSARAIDCATELARKLGLSNVRFESADIADMSALASDSGGEYDLITAVTAFNEAVEFPTFDASRPLRPLLREYARNAKVEPLEHVAGLLRADTGVLVSLEQWHIARGYGWWVSALQNAGFAVDFRESGQIRFKDLNGEPHAAPALLTHKPDVSLTADLEDVIAFWLRPDFQKDDGTLRPFTTFHDLAEEIFVSANPKKFLFGMKVEMRDAPDIRRLELWRANSFVLLFKFDLSGMRELQVLPGIYTEEARSRIEELADDMRADGEVSAYHTPEINWGEPRMEHDRR